MSFDVAIVDSGPAGYRAAIAAAHLGARVALIERGVPGDTCLNEGCIPNKALVHFASLLEAAVDPYAAALDRSGRNIFERGIFAPAQ